MFKKFPFMISGGSRRDREIYIKSGPDRLVQSYKETGKRLEINNFI
jgi:hypothetical protein